MDLSAATNMIKNLPPWLLLGAGFVSGWLKSFWTFFYDHTIGWLSNKCKVELVIEEQDHLEAFVWVNMWMEAKLRAKNVAKLRLQRKTGRTDQEREEKAFELLPSYGFYWLWWKYKLLTFYSEKKDSSGGADYDGKKLVRTVTLELWGTRNRNLLLDIIMEAREEFEKLAPKSMKFYTHTSDYWESYSMDQRSLETVYLTEKQLKDILTDFQKFFMSKEKYRSLGIPWRRTYLLEGPPGSGKSTLVQALSSHFKVPIYYFNVSKTSANTARALLFAVSSPCIILMEDIDSIEAAKTRIKKTTKKLTKTEEGKPDLGLNPSELLNLLDGIIATEQRIVIMTTNHPETLDAAILRPGRTDRRFHLGFAADAELRRFYSNASKYYTLPEYEVFRKQLPLKSTIANAQDLLFKLTNQEGCDKVEE